MSVSVMDIDSVNGSINIICQFNGGKDGMSIQISGDNGYVQFTQADVITLTNKLVEWLESASNKIQCVEKTRTYVITYKGVDYIVSRTAFYNENGLQDIDHKVHYVDDVKRVDSDTMDEVLAYLNGDE